MFWRKRKAKDLHLELDGATPSAAERRETFRIGSDPDNPIIATIDGVEHVVANISAGGLALRSKALQAGAKYSVRLQLPDGSPAILTEFEVVNTTPQGLCRCKFLALSVLSRNALHRYILRREKQQIRSTRVRRAVTADDE